MKFPPGPPFFRLTFAMSTSLNSKAYKHVRNLIMSDQIEVGERLSEARIARELGVSRTPVREAIRRLCGDGVLYQVPSSGTFIAMPGRTEIIEAYEVRESLECSMLIKAVKKTLPRHRVALRKYLQQMRMAARAMRDAGDEYLTGEPRNLFLEADMAAHSLILKIAGNDMALGIVSNAQLRNRIFGNHSHRRDLEHVSRVLLLHARLTRAICKGDSKMALHWMRTHIRESRHEAVATYAEQAKRNDPRQLSWGRD